MYLPCSLAMPWATRLTGTKLVKKYAWDETAFGADRAGDSNSNAAGICM